MDLPANPGGLFRHLRIRRAFPSERVLPDCSKTIWPGRWEPPAGYLVIDSLIVDGVIDALGLDRDSLADDEVRSRLSRAMQASLMIQGSVYQLPSGPLCNLKMLTSEDARPIELIDYQFTAGIHLRKDLSQINRQLLTRIMEKYPLQAFVVEVTGNQVLLNLGATPGGCGGHHLRCCRG